MREEKNICIFHRRPHCVTRRSDIGGWGGKPSHHPPIRRHLQIKHPSKDFSWNAEMSRKTSAITQFGIWNTSGCPWSLSSPSSSPVSRVSRHITLRRNRQISYAHANCKEWNERWDNKTLFTPPSLYTRNGQVITRQICSHLLLHCCSTFTHSSQLANIITTDCIVLDIPNAYQSVLPVS